LIATSAECAHVGVRSIAVRWLAMCLVACGHSDSAPLPRATSGTPGLSGSPGESAVTAEDAPAPCDGTPVALGDDLTVESRRLVVTAAVTSEPCVQIVRASATRYVLRVFTSRDGDPAPAPAWRDRMHLVAAINAGMFHESGDPVGLIVERGTVIGTDNDKMSGFFAFDPVSPKDPPVAMAGRTCPGFDLAALRKRYRSLVQSYRLLDCDGHPITWQDPKLYSAAAIGLDRAGRIVFVHARGASTMTDFARSLPNDLAGALFLEGGPEASLVVRGDRGEVSRVGSYETGFVENDGNTAFWPLPNIIGLAPAPAASGAL
jgi:hypothetical protein